jgi:hypothetical protein
MLHSERRRTRRRGSGAHRARSEDRTAHGSPCELIATTRGSTAVDVRTGAILIASADFGADTILPTIGNPRDTGDSFVTVFDT